MLEYSQIVPRVEWDWDMLCGITVELWKKLLHTLCDCSLLMQLWLHLDPLYIRDEFFNGDLQHWFHFNVNCVVIWREEVEWSGVMCGLLRVTVLVCGAIKNFMIIISISIPWRPPLQGWVKLNKDGVSEQRWKVSRMRYDNKLKKQTRTNIIITITTAFQISSRYNLYETYQV
jgi:hypothetical protein